MDNKNYAVITGDIVDSTGIQGDYKEILEGIASDIQKHQDKGFRFEIYRGDSFQGLITDPVQALKIGILYRAGLRRYTKGNSVENIWDARIAIGIGTIKDVDTTIDLKLNSADGEAFVRSGRSLNSMKHEGLQLKICTGDQTLDDEFTAVCPLLDAIIGRWTTSQAEAVYMQLLEGITQEEIGRRLGISQRASGKRLESSTIYGMKQYFNRYNKVIEWKFSN